MINCCLRGGQRGRKISLEEQVTLVKPTRLGKKKIEREEDKFECQVQVWYKLLEGPLLHSRLKHTGEKWMNDSEPGRNMASFSSLLF